MGVQKGIIVLCGLSICFIGFIFAENPDINYLPGEVIVKFKDTNISQGEMKSGIENKLNILSSSNKDIHIKKNIDFLNMAIVSVPRDIEIQKIITELESDPNVEYVEPNYIYKPLSLPNDPQYTNLRAFPFFHWDDALPIIRDNIPQNPSVVVAVIDVGVDYLHPDLIHNMWDGSNCVSNTGVYIGGCQGGYDFWERDKEPNALYSSHGTHVAGTIAATMDNGIGVVGMNPYAKIIGIRAGIDNAIYNTSAIEGINFAIHNGAKVINASFGLTTYSQAMYDAIRIFGEHGGLFVTAAGNDSKNHTTNHGYPCDYDLDNIICVGSVSSSNGLSYFSDWSSGYIDVLAPGESIRSTTFSTQTNTISETFGMISTGEIPIGWTKIGSDNTWGARRDTGFNSQALSMYQSVSGYMANANFGVMKQENLSNLLRAELLMDISCDTEYNENYWKDYLTVSFSSDGVNFDQIEQIDEVRIDVKKSYPKDGVGVSIARGYSREIPSKYRTSDFALKLGWISNESDNDHKGCSLDNIKINKEGIGSHSYWDMQGTSMASPHVAGLASLVRGVQPNLTYNEVKKVIFENVDYITGLNTKVVTSGKINVNKTLSALISGSKLSYVSLSSSNIHPNYATSGDTITLSFSGNMLSGLAEVYINGSLLELTGSATLWTAKYLVTGGTSNANMLFDIRYRDILDYEGIMTYTTDDSWVYVDTISPSITISTPSSNVTGSTIQIQGTGSDLGNLYQIVVNNTIVSGTNNRSQIVSLHPGVNPIVVTGYDYAGNMTTISSTITKIPYTYSGTYTIIDANTVKINFNSDFVAEGFVRYGTGGLIDIVSSGEAINHSILLSNLVPNTTYSYQTYAVYQGSTGVLSSLRSFKTPNIHHTEQGGNRVVTGSVFFVGSGVVSTGTASLYSDNGENFVSIPNSTGLVNRIIYGPIQIDFTGTTPVTSNYTHVPGLTFEVDHDDAPMIFSGTNLPQMYLNVGTIYNSKVLKVYRSEDKTNYLYIADCAVVNGICTFTTNSFSTFTILAPNVVTPSSSGGGGGGGGGGATVTVDKLILPIDTGATIITGNMTTLTGVNMDIYGLNKCIYPLEIQQAYLFAYKNGITTQLGIMNADMNGGLIRAHLAKMISNYAINVLGKTPDTKKLCTFVDISNETSEMRGYIKTVCQLGLMGQNTTKFDPTGTVNRAQFSTILSRLLYGSLYEGGTPYYTKHIDALKRSEVIKSIDPNLKEIRGYIMLMLMRSKVVVK